MIDEDFVVWDEAAETGAAPEGLPDMGAPWEGPQEETAISETTVSAANTELLELPPPRPSQSSPTPRESWRTGEMRKDADRTTGRTWRRLSKLEDPAPESNTWGAENSEEKQTGPPLEEERDTGKFSEIPEHSTSILMEGISPERGNPPAGSPLLEYGKQRGESREEDTIPRDLERVDTKTGSEYPPDG